MTTLPGPHGAAALRATKQLLDTPRSTRSSRSPTSYGRTFAVHLGPTADRRSSATASW